MTSCNHDQEEIFRLYQKVKVLAERAATAEQDRIMCSDWCDAYQDRLKQAQDELKAALDKVCGFNHNAISEVLA